MAVSQVFDWNKILGTDPSVLAEQQRKLLEEELARNKEYDQFTLQQALDAKRQQDAYEAMLQLIDSGENYTDVDMYFNRQGIRTPAMEQAEKMARLAEVYGVDLEKLDPNNPTLSKYYATNEHDWQNSMDRFEQETPDEYRVAYKPEGGILRNIASGIFGVGQNVAQKRAYDESYEKAVENMRRDGMSGKEIEEQLNMNQSYHKSKQGLLDKLFNKSSQDGFYAGKYYQGNYAKDGIGGMYGMQATKSNIAENFEKEHPDLMKMFRLAEPKTMQDYIDENEKRNKRFY